MPKRKKVDAAPLICRWRLRRRPDGCRRTRRLGGGGSRSRRRRRLPRDRAPRSPSSRLWRPSSGPAYRAACHPPPGDDRPLPRAGRATMPRRRRWRPRWPSSGAFPRATAAGLLGRQGDWSASFADQVPATTVSSVPDIAGGLRIVAREEGTRGRRGLRRRLRGSADDGDDVAP